MKNKKILLAVVMALIVLSTSAYAKTYVIGDQKTPVEMPSEEATYVGADVCKECHVEKYDNWITSGHPYKLMTPEKALEIRPEIPMPEGYTEDDILYVIGGWGWKARFMDTDGYIITKTGEIGASSFCIPVSSIFNIIKPTKICKAFILFAC